MKMLLVLLISLFWAAVAVAQVTCVQYGQFLSCDGPWNQNFTQLDLGNGMGVITDSKGNVIPYAVLTPQSPQAPQAPQLLFVPFSNDAPRAPTSGWEALAPQAPRAPSSWEPIEPSVLTQPW